VDIEPGDRLATCGGLMEPTGIIIVRDVTSVMQRCVSCGHERKNRIAANDDMKVVMELSTKPPPGYFSLTKNGRT